MMKLSQLGRAATKPLSRAAAVNPAMRTLLRRLLHAGRLRRYRTACRRTTVEDKTVVFECYGGRSYTCSPRAIYRSMLDSERFSDYEFVWALREEDVHLLRDGDAGPAVARFGPEAVDELSRATLVRFGSTEYLNVYARAGTWISNYILPSYLVPRENQRYLQTWHGTPLKRLGCDIAPDKQSAMFTVDEIHQRYRAEGERFTWLICSSPFACDKLASAFDIVAERRPSTLICEGYPRNDSLIDEGSARSGEIRRRLGIPDRNRVLLYAPTFRDDQRTVGVGYTFSHLPDFDLLKDHLGDTHTILFRGHYLLAEGFDFERYGGFVIDASTVSEINDLYLVSDMLVTDYSSVFFDYANLERPVAFYMHDLERYRGELRGFYLDLDELPGPVTHTTAELLEAIRAQQRPDSERAERLRAFRTRFAPLDDGNAAARVLERVFNAEPTGHVSRSGDNRGVDVL